MNNFSFEKYWQDYKPKGPIVLQGGIARADFKTSEKADSFLPELRDLFPFTADLRRQVVVDSTKQASPASELKVGVVLSGGPAPGGHNVITGLFDAVCELSGSTTLIGFCGGIAGLLRNDFITLDKTQMDLVRNTGGFNLLGTGRTKVENHDDMFLCLNTARAHRLDALVIIGGDDSNTNAAFLAEFFSKIGGQFPSVIGVPKTIDGDLKNNFVETSFGFDTATKVYAGLVSNIARDALSTKKQYHFVKLMGRSASHVTLEVALLVKPNFIALTEEVLDGSLSLDHLIDEICSLVRERAKSGKFYGVILIPEGLADVFTETRSLGESLGLKSDPHGNPDLSTIDTERLLVLKVAERLASQQGEEILSFSAKTHFLGYKGRCATPSLFDADYAYSLGRLAGLMAVKRVHGNMAVIRNLHETDREKWRGEAIPFLSMLGKETRKSANKWVIKKGLVDLEGKAYKHWMAIRPVVKTTDCYEFYPGVCYFGPSELTEPGPRSLTLDPIKVE